MNRLRMGIVGSGRLGSFHASKAYVHPEVELVGVFDVNRENAQKIANQYDAKAFDSLDELAAQVQAAVIAVPSVLHYEIAQALLEKKISLLVEKPMTTRGHEAKNLLQLAQSNDLVIMAGHTEQYNPIWQHGKEMLQSGQPCFIEARRTSGYTFRSTDIGVVLDLMIHDLELIFSAKSAEITQLSAFGYSLFGGHEDFAQAQLTFADGTAANLVASRIEHEAVRNMRISSAQKSATLDFALRKFVAYIPAESIRAGEFSPERVPVDAIAQLAPTFMQNHFTKIEQSYEAVDALTLEMADFASAILHKKQPQAAVSNAVRALGAAEKILSEIRS